MTSTNAGTGVSGYQAIRYGPNESVSAPNNTAALNHKTPLHFRAILSRHTLRELWHTRQVWRGNPVLGTGQAFRKLEPCGDFR